MTFDGVLLCAVTLLVLPASAAVYGGECGVEGDNLTWSLDTKTGVLTISGEGYMADYGTVDSTEKSGCGAVLTGGASMIALLTLADACLVCKKKKD